MVHTFALIILVLLNINPSVDNRGSDIPEEEHGHHWEHESGPVLSDSKVDVAIFLEGSEG